MQAPINGYGDWKPAGRWTVVQVLVVVAVIVFLLQAISTAVGNPDMVGLLGLHGPGIRRGWWWQFVTYTFLHGDLLHLLMNLFMLVFFGREMESLLGRARFLVLYLLSGILAGIGWLLLGGFSGGVCIGASGAVFGVTGAFAALYPNRVINLLLFFVVPVTLTARTLALGVVVLSVLMMTTGGGGVAHSAHLAGVVYGWGYGWWLRRLGIGWSPFPPLQDSWRTTWHRMMQPADGPPPEADVNRVLEKIRTVGMGRLSRQDRRILERAGQYGVRREPGS
ncbi:MAG: hypothetical protein A2269_03125 [Lentisphaerae bacterium RIFOXYA12_FULL_60_10]|nr:MAG: hypothetical protein A2269_03125 [Lentisphaerae bacterium RIFOXYA12_FULL_60_10]